MELHDEILHTLLFVQNEIVIVARWWQPQLHDEKTNADIIAEAKSSLDIEENTITMSK